MKACLRFATKYLSAIDSSNGMHPRAFGQLATGRGLPPTGRDWASALAGTIVDGLRTMSRDRFKLDAFRLADDLAVLVYEDTRSLGRPDEDLRRQLRRAALSVPANIAEGCARRSKADYVRFLDIALGSASEVASLLDFSARLRVLPDPALTRCSHCCARTVRALQKLIDALLALP
jgi:four helix bundle protein